MNPGDLDADPDQVIRSFIQNHSLTIQSELPKPNSSSKTITVRSTNLIHDLRIDTSKLYISLYTYTNSTPLPFLSRRDNTLYYVAYLNEFLTVTSLDVDPSSGDYKLKSSQGFPRGMDFGVVLEYFWQRHLIEFPILKANIDEFCSNNLDPQLHAKKLHSELGSLKLS